MKIIGIDRYSRVGNFDVLIKANVNVEDGNKLVEKYNKRAGERIYKLVNDDYALYLRGTDR